MQVRQERTNWRDEGLSERHRLWGWDCPAIDIDFLALEYNKGKAVALVEYKNEHARKQDYSHPSYRALVDLGDKATLPVFVCRYSDNFMRWEIDPIGKVATRKFEEHKIPSRVTLTEKRYVKFLYWLRGAEAPPEVLEQLNG